MSNGMIMRSCGQNNWQLLALQTISETEFEKWMNERKQVRDKKGKERGTRKARENMGKERRHEENEKRELVPERLSSLTYLKSRNLVTRTLELVKS